MRTYTQVVVLLSLTMLVCHRPLIADDEPLRSIKNGDVRLVDIHQFASRAGWTAKEETRDKLLVLCHESDTPVCVPIRLDKVLTKRVGERLYVEMSAVEDVFEIERFGPINNRPSSGLVIKDTAYNSPWPRGRGFDVGQTLPNIPLVDMKGNEVRFDTYLGKRYIIYCWASW